MKDDSSYDSQVEASIRSGLTAAPSRNRSRNAEPAPTGERADLPGARPH